ncbi:amino acid ABC transporter permease [Ancrocorticia populi]|uniref:amino acid ABC transporter permease n=1 Tax=Ancrocorticia populi TaxID=2175228 RepID=UPI003F98C0CB
MSRTISDFFDEPGPIARRRTNIVTAVGVVIFIGVIAWIGYMLADKGQFAAEKWTPFLEVSTWTTYFVPGILGTLKAAALAIIFSNALGLILGIMRLAQSTFIRIVGGTLVEFFRAVPVLVLMLFFYFMFAAALDNPADAPFWGVVCGLTMYNGAVIAELVASGVKSLPAGQSEAGLALGMTSGRTLASILLPQGLIAMMPSMVAQLVVILKDTALGYTITYFELLNRAKTFGSAYQNYLPALFVAAVMFIIVNIILGQLARILSTKLESATGLTAPEQQGDPEEDLALSEMNADITPPMKDLSAAKAAH